MNVRSYCAEYYFLSEIEIATSLNNIGVLKVGLSPSKKIVLIYSNESSLKVIKDVFYFMLKSLFVLEIFTFCPDVLFMQKNSLIRKLWLISKFIASQTGQEIISIHRLFNISRSKGNQIMKFGQLIEYSMTSIFLEIMQCDGETSSRLLYKKN